MNTSSTFNVVSFNVFGSPFHPQRIIRSMFRNQVRKRFKIIADELTNGSHDILAFQEVLTYPHFLFLRRQLPSFPYVAYERGLYGPKGGLAIFSKVPFDKVVYITFKKSGVFWNKSITGPLTQKGMLIIWLKEPNIWILNTHLTQNADWDYAKTNRFIPFLEAQLQECSQAIKSLAANSHNIVVMGDFNAPKNSVYYHAFLESANVADVFLHDNSPTTHASFAPKGVQLERIDYIFLHKQSNLTIENKNHLFTEEYEFINGETGFVSDHIGLSVTFRKH